MSEYIFPKNLDTTTKVSETATCPHCAHPATGASGEKTPKPGDLAVCIECFNINVYGPDFTLHAMTPEEEADLKTAGDEFANFVDTVKRLREENPKWKKRLETGLKQKSK